MKQSNLNVFFRNICIYVLIFSILGVALWIEQKGYSASTNTNDSNLIDEDKWYTVKNTNAGKISDSAPRCLIIYENVDPSNIAFKDNFSYVLNSINVSVEELGITVYEEIDEGVDEEAGEQTDEILTDESAISKESSQSYDQAIGSQLDIKYDEYDDIIVCVSSLSSFGLSIEEIYQWCKNGGHLMIAGGIDESIDYQAWSELLGINASETIQPIYADSLQFNTDLLAGVNGREFSDDVIACEIMDVTLNESCVLYASTSDEYGSPLLWENNVDKGSVIVCNSDIMESKSDRGIIAAAYCRFYPVYVYPVINACVYCVDDMPSPIPAGYDKNIISQYGYTISDFYANVWMPAMQELYEKYHIKFSTFAVQSYEDNVEEPFNNKDNQKTASYYASLILNMEGEIGIHGYNHQPLVLDGYIFDEENTGYKPWNSVSAMLKSIKAAISYTESLADDLYVQSYVAPSNVVSEEALKEMLSQLEDIRVYAGVYVGTPDQFIQEYSVLDNGAVFCPRLTADMQMEDSEWWTQINELNYHYIESNFIHPDDILDEERSDGGDFNQMISGYSEMIEWNQSMLLKNTTISECGAAVQRYSNLNYSQLMTDNTLEITVDGLIDTAYLMLRTNGKRVVNVEGGTVAKLTDDIYILEISNPNVRVKLVDKK